MPEHLANETELLARARQGDGEAFLALARHYERNIFRIGLNITGNQEDAEDVLQETFLKAFANLSGFHGDSRFYTWLVRIAMNEALMKLRKRKTENSVPLGAPEAAEEGEQPREIVAWVQNPEQKFAQHELRQILGEAIAKLPHAYRTVVLLRDVEGFSTEETAGILDMGIPAVKSRLLRGRLMLRENLTRHFKRGMSYPLRRSGAQAVPLSAAKSPRRRVQGAAQALGALLEMSTAVPA
jgi:RNA polymerase sigma-70 factor (ECF subfamily)